MEKEDKLRYCIEYINPRFPLLDNGDLNVRHLRVPDEHWAEMAITLILSFGGKIYALYRGNVKDGKLADWPAPMIVESGDWFTDEWLHELTDCGQKEDYDKIKKVLAIDFMHFLDGNRPEGKMCLSNGECADIEKAFGEQDWSKLSRYLDKYLVDGGGSEIQNDKED